ncbi:HAD family hydrolase [Algibacillus agarilyticus]|uniref:HAD family hydrolase n=1 Tax=Algibacillus agarilyticus TaxID=2234133 RepID=UPI000DD0CADB|nr:HAD family phosphatase [Algibacillus agarilyticus]
MINLTNAAAYLFDMDGTIFDSEAMYCQAWIQCANEFDLVFTAEMYQPFIGVPTQQCLPLAQHIFGRDFNLQPFLSRFIDILDTKKKAGVPFKPGFIDFFAWVLKQNKPTALVTSSNLDGVIKSFAYHNLSDKFDAIITRDDISAIKPDPECYLLACKTLNILPQDTLVFEDSNTGLLAAINAGCQAIAIPDQIAIKPEIKTRCYQVTTSFEALLSHVD